MREDGGSSSRHNGRSMPSSAPTVCCQHQKGRIKRDGSKLMVSLGTMVAMATALSSSSNVSTASAFTLSHTSMARKTTPASAAPFEYIESSHNGPQRYHSKYRAKRRSSSWLGLSSTSASPTKAQQRRPHASQIRTKKTWVGTASRSSQSSHASVTMADYGRKDAYTMESEILRLIANGQTADALSLYQSVWTHDDNTDDNAINNDLKRQRRGPSCCKPSTRLMNHAILACAKSPSGPMIDRAFDILHFAMNGGARGVRRLSPNVYTFGALVKACAMLGDVQRCVGLIHQMRNDFKIQPNAVIYSTAIAACKKSNPPQPDMAIRLLQECVNPPHLHTHDNHDSTTQNTATETTTTTNNVSMMDGTMNIVGYNAALSVCAVGGRWEMALQLLDEMNHNCRQTENKNCYVDDNIASSGDRILHPDVVSPPPDSVTYGTVMAACERSEQWKPVMVLAKLMEDLEQLPSDDNDDNSLPWDTIRMDGMALTTALHACQHLGLGEEAVHYLNKMKQLTNRTDTQQHSQHSQHSPSTTTTTTKRKPLHGPDDVAYLLAISACARASHWKQGLRLLREMESVTGHKPNVGAYTSAITGCATAGEYQRAIQLMEVMQSDESGRLRPNVVTYSTVIRACAAACMKAAARKRLQQDNDFGVQLESDDWDVRPGWTTSYGENEDSFESSMSLSSVEEPLQAALSILQQMTHNDTVVDPNIVTYNAAILACAEGLDIDKAFELWTDLLNRGLQPTEVTYGTLMLACERVGNVNGVIRIFKAMKDQNERSSSSDNTSIRPNEIIYGTAISCFRKAGQPERAATLLCKMVNEGLAPNIATFNTVLTALTEDRAPDLDKALAVYKILRSTKHVPATQPSHQTYNILIRAMACDGRPDEAEFFLGEMSSDGFVPEVDLYTLTVSSYEKKREPLKALKVMESMSRDGYDFYDVKVLNAAFKRAVKLANVVGKTLATTTRDDLIVGDNDDDTSSLSLETDDSGMNDISFEKEDFATER